MIIQGVFSMSILDRLRSFFGMGDKEEENESEANNAKDDVNVTSSKKKLNDNIVSGTKT